MMFNPYVKVYKHKGQETTPALWFERQGAFQLNQKPNKPKLYSKNLKTNSLNP
jgi:hypothetical protein